MRSTLRSLWAWTAIVTLIVLWTPLLAVIRLFDRDPAHYRTGRWFRRLGALMTYVNPAWNVTISGNAPANPRNPYVVVCNHLSQADIPVVSRVPWEMKWVAKADLFRMPFVGWLMRMAGDIPVERKNKMSRARVLVHAREYLNKQCSVILFPEGTRSRDGRVWRFNDGAFRLAIRAQVPILPLALDGTQNALPKNSWRFGGKSNARLHILDPVPTEGLTPADTEALRQRVRAQVIEQIATWRGVAPAEVDALTPKPEAEADTAPAPDSAPESASAPKRS